MINQLSISLSTVNRQGHSNTNPLQQSNHIVADICHVKYHRDHSQLVPALILSVRLLVENQGHTFPLKMITNEG